MEGRNRGGRERERSCEVRGGESGKNSEWGDDSNVECRSRIVDRDRYYWQEEKGSERGDEREKEGEKAEKEKRKKRVPSARFEEQRP